MRDQSAPRAVPGYEADLNLTRLGRLFIVFGQETSIQLFRSSNWACAALRLEICRTFSMMVFTRPLWRWMISAMRLSPASRPCDSPSKLGGVADGAQWIADFVGDTGGQPAQRSQFHLLRLLGDLTGVFQKNQQLLAGVLAHAGEVGLYLGRQVPA